MKLNPPNTHRSQVKICEKRQTRNVQFRFMPNAFQKFLSQFRKAQNAFECFVTQVQTWLPKTKRVWPLKINVIWYCIYIQEHENLKYALVYIVTFYRVAVEVLGMKILLTDGLKVSDLSHLLDDVSSKRTRSLPEGLAPEKIVDFIEGMHSERFTKVERAIKALLCW